MYVYLLAYIHTQIHEDQVYGAPAAAGGSWPRAPVATGSCRDPNRPARAHMAQDVTTIRAFRLLGVWHVRTFSDRCSFDQSTRAQTQLKHTYTHMCSSQCNNILHTQRPRVETTFRSMPRFPACLHVNMEFRTHMHVYRLENTMDGHLEAALHSRTCVDSRFECEDLILCNSKPRERLAAYVSVRASIPRVVSS